mmetsp:Transcript_23356/g.67610  ORF Transcript_23356/g.67610 Transcript_23356/m.67610 type:complete len:235 (+) Transcript_23356:337-1041(+)
MDEPFALMLELMLAFLDAGAVHGLLGGVPNSLQRAQVTPLLFLPVRRPVHATMLLVLFNLDPNVAIFPHEPSIADRRLDPLAIDFRDKAVRPGTMDRRLAAISGDDDVTFNHFQEVLILLMHPHAIQCQRGPAALGLFLEHAAFSAAAAVQAELLHDRLQEGLRHVGVARAAGHIGEVRLGTVVLADAWRRRHEAATASFGHTLLGAVDRNGLADDWPRIFILAHAHDGLEVLL